jgi:hypothetical protein
VTRRGIHALAGLREPHASRGALHERDAEPVFELAQRLAHRRAAHAEPLAGGAEASRFGDGDEHGHTVEVVGHWEADLTDASTFVK